MRNLQFRFGALPVDTTRVARHIAAEDVAVGDFLHTYDFLMQSRLLARPPGRKSLAVGDGDCYVARDGSRCEWRAAGLHADGALKISVSLSRPRALFAAGLVVLWRGALPWALEPPGGQEVLVGGAPAGGPTPETRQREALLDELFAPADLAAVWAAERGRLDLYDWEESPPGEAGVARAAAGADPGWVVRTPHDTFVWRVARGQNVVRRIAGDASPTGADFAERVRALFVKPPDFADVQV